MQKRVPQIVSSVMSERGRKGAKAAHSQRTPAQRKALAKKAAAARWGKHAE